MNGPSVAKHARADHSSELKNTAVMLMIRLKQDFAGKIQDIANGRTGQLVQSPVVEEFNSDVDFTFVRCKTQKHNQGNHS